MGEISLDSVEVCFGGYCALKDISFRVPSGQFVSLIGPTGCGKTSILNLAAGLLRASAGQILKSGKALETLNRDAILMFQNDALLPWKTAIENVLLAPLLAGVPKPKAAADAADWLRRVGLSGFEHRYPGQLSGGQRKRVAMAQALISRRSTLLMDEPFSALDVQTRTVMETELLRLWEGTGATVLFVTHDPEEAIAMSDRILLFTRGPNSRLKADYAVDLPRPRNVAEVKLAPGFSALYKSIWENLKEEVLPAYAS
ncbi:MAG: ABC transporter ATP-binding protein [Acidobacteria bacterium]|nr:ABC transporter ATP-binding protein [Acidobacteriota bacterium]